MSEFAPWFGSLPAGWRFPKISHAFRSVSSGTTPDTESTEYYGGVIPWVTTSELRETIILNTSKNITQQAVRDHSALRIYPPNTVLIAMYGATIGRIGILGIPAATNQACCALTEPVGVLPHFMFYVLLAARPYILSLASGGGQPNVNQQVIRSLRIPLPPTSCQCSIIDLLDRETAKLDVLIARQTEFLTRLDEHRRALITDAVTHGLDPATSSQVTGLTTFPAIPKHWALRPLMHLVKPTRPINYGVLMPGPRVVDGIPLIEAGDVMAGPIQPPKLRRTTIEIEAPFARSRLNPGDVVVAIRGSIGAAQVVPETLTNANVTRDAARISPQSGVNSQYLAYVLGSDALRDHYASQSLGAAVQGINISDLKRAPIPLPPPEEQSRIADYLNRHVGQVERTQVAGRKMIERLRERRAALITAAVTGQIDVTKPALTEAAA